MLTAFTVALVLLIDFILILLRLGGWRPGACFPPHRCRVGVVSVWIRGTDSFTMREMESSTLYPSFALITGLLLRP